MTLRLLSSFQLSVVGGDPFPQRSQRLCVYDTRRDFFHCGKAGELDSI
jgi:hypothetical protein